MNANPILWPTIAGCLLLSAAAPAFGQETTPPLAKPGAKSSPPKAKPATPPQVNIDKDIEAPASSAPPSDQDSPKHQADAIDKRDDSVKKVPAAPSEPGKPGVRKL